MSSHRSEAFSVWRRSTRVGCLIDEDLIMGASGGVRPPQHHWLRPRGLSGRTCRWLIAIYRATVPNARYRFAKQGGCHPSLTRCRTALLAQFQFQLGDRGHDAGDGAPSKCWCPRLPAATARGRHGYSAHKEPWRLRGRSVRAGLRRRPRGDRLGGGNRCTRSSWVGCYRRDRRRCR